MGRSSKWIQLRALCWRWWAPQSLYLRALPTHRCCGLLILLPRLLLGTSPQLRKRGRKSRQAARISRHFTFEGGLALTLSVCQRAWFLLPRQSLHARLERGRGRLSRLYFSPFKMLPGAARKTDA